jgi:hypothetical protein
MSTQDNKLTNSDTIRHILQSSNDILHQSIAEKQIVVIATQNKDDLSKFTIVADSVYEKELEGVVLTFANPKDYLRLFPQAPENPTHQPPGTEPGPDGNPVPIHKDPYAVKAIASTPKSYSDVFHERNVLDGNGNTKWAIKANPASLTLDLGSQVEVGTVWIWWANGDERQFKFNIGISSDEEQTFENIWTADRLSQGKFNDYEPYNLSSSIPGQTVKCRFIHISVKGNTKNGDWASIVGVRITKAVSIESVEQEVVEPTEPPVVENGQEIDQDIEPVDLTGPEPPKPTNEGRPQPEKKGDWDQPELWTLVKMNDDPLLIKIIDKNKINIADQFKTVNGAKDFKRWYIWKVGQQPKPVDPPVVTEPPTKPIDPNAKVDAQGIVMIYAPKQGGQVVTAKETNQKESKHNTGTRSSLYSNKPYSANNGELTEYFIMDLSDDGEQNAPKLLSGGHTGSGNNNETKQGQCYAVGVNQNGTLHLAKEYPHHPTTPKAYDKIQYLNPNWKNLGGNIRNKLVGMKIIYFPVTKNGKTGMHIEWWFDKKGLQTGKVENDWVQMAFTEDFGDWGSKFGPPHLENMGVKYNGKILGFYIRIDTPKKPVKFQNQGQHELELPPRKLI